MSARAKSPPPRRGPSEAKSGSRHAPRAERGGAAGDTQRRISIWLPDWPVAALGMEADAPVAVVTANRVVACSHAAREHGARRGRGRDEAQAACPSVAVLPRNEDAEARAFEPVVAALEAIAPG